MSLSISLTNPFVLLNGTTDRAEAAYAFVQGTLALQVSKTIAISSIEVLLEGKTKSGFVQGAGAREVYVSEDRIFLSQKSVLYAGSFLLTQEPLPEYASTSGPPPSPKPKFRLFSSRKDDANATKAEFQPGTYTYPFSIPIPHNSPITAKFETGSVSYQLKARAHRPGTFKLDLSAGMDVLVVACPPPDEHNLIVESQWEKSLRYRFEIMGRTFLAGSEVPLDITLLPLAPIKVYLISAIFEEKATFSAKSSPHINNDPQRVFHVVNLKGSVPEHRPLLPVASGAVGAVTSSPLYEYVALKEQGSDLPAIEQHLTRGDGPWQLTIKMKVPAKFNASHDHPESNVKVAHKIRLTFRVETGDFDQKSRKRGVFDIALQFPIRIVSDLCKDEWSSLQLPTYQRSVEAGQSFLEGILVGSDLSSDEVFRTRAQQAQAYTPPPAPIYVAFMSSALADVWT